MILNQDKPIEKKNHDNLIKKIQQDKQNTEEYKPINICASNSNHSNVTVGLPGVIPFRVSFQFLLSLAGASATSII
jgi:hypothetical protein